MLENSDLLIRAVLAILVLQSVYIWYAVIKFIFTVRRVNTECDDLNNAIAAMDIGGIRAQLQRFAHLLVRANGQSTAPRQDLEASPQALAEASAANANHVLFDEVWGEVYDDLTRNCPGLSTIAATAPFIGLFGTVWGILHAFSSVRAAEAITFSALAPAIGEALFATMAGLFVAIPAVVANNALATRSQRLARRFTQAFTGLVTEVARLGRQPVHSDW
ncbi:MAG: MotA/TolQ/ExbB proton channel family protein [Alphaproteobacteria bacterium]|nr:MotA/TolQ/ExbB proton channel family protein [Alphaproteobacteria bacterium]